MENASNTFTRFDIAALVIAGALAVRCMFRGFVKELFSLAGIIGGIFLARCLRSNAAELFFPDVEGKFLSETLGFALILVAVVSASTIGSWLISRIIKKSILGAFNRIGGLAIGALQGAILAGVFVAVVSGISGGLENSFLKDSFFAPVLLNMIQAISGIISDNDMASTAL
ncbi:MAG TPA: CvpA family protein [bacterium]|nr:CvpA family protein [bacterium]